jgi:aromatic-L-amino-acid/L-tryptophan decarboxylase
MTPDEFRRFGHELIDWIADYRAQIEAQPVMPKVEPGEIKARLPVSAPEVAEPFATVLTDFREKIAPGILHWQHPRFFGFFPSNGTLSSVLGDVLSTGLGVIGLSWQSSPALSELEEVVCDWVRQLVDLSPAWSGVIQDTASTSSLVALVCAREKSSAYGLAREGLQGDGPRLAVYVSQMSHSSVEKAALLAGFGRAFVRSIPVDDAFAMRADLLEEAIAKDRAAGVTPCAIVATTGTTTTTAVDPLGPIGALAKKHGAWLHVDAAMAGSAMLLPECRWMWDGIEQADSIVVNAHKWLGAAFDCSLYYVQDPQHLVRVMSTNPSYLQSAVDDRVKNLRDWGIPLGRRFRALKLWFMLREQGAAALRARLRRDLENAAWLEAQVRAAPGWRVLAPVVLQTVCVRHEPDGITGDALEHHTQAWAEALNASGHAYVTPAQLGGSWMVRVSIGALPTERAHVEALWQAMQRTAMLERPR